MYEGGIDVIQLPKHSNVLMHLDCYAELIELIHQDEYPSFIADYKERIEFLIGHFGTEQQHRKWFEVLKKAKGLRSIHFMKFRNLRILYMLENKRAYLLLAFEEKQGHRVTEYSNYIDPALKRMSEKEKML